MKKRTLAAVLLLVLSIPAASHALIQEERDDICEKVAGVAEKMQEANQSGVDIGVALSISKSRAVRALVIDAYSEPEYATKDYQLKAIRTFKTKVYLKCIKDLEVNE